MARNNSERPGQAQNNANGQDRPSEKAMVNWTRIVGFFTGLLFVATGVSDYIIWRELRDNETTQSLDDEQRRAFFGLGAAIQIPGADKAGQPAVGFVARWQNLGGTRTKWADAWASIQYFPDEVPNNFDPTKPRNSISTPVHSVVGPNQPMESSPIGITHDETVQADTGKGALLVWGAIEYADLYDPENTHHGRFCAKLVPSGIAVNQATKQTFVIYQSQPYRNDCNTTE